MADPRHAENALTREMLTAIDIRFRQFQELMTASLSEALKEMHEDTVKQASKSRKDVSSIINNKLSNQSVAATFPAVVQRNE
jgi:hypothetical protein